MKKCFILLFGVLAAFSFSAYLASQNSGALVPNYTGTLSGYEYCCTTERDRAWEEDLLYLADAYLTGHPLLADDSFWTKTWSVDTTFLDEELSYDNSLYNEELRASFISGINDLIARIPVLSNCQIVFEAQKLIATLRDSHSNLHIKEVCTMQLPLFLEAIGSAEGYSYYVTDLSAEHSGLLYSKLCSINGIAISEVAERLSGYVSTESMEFTTWFLGAGKSLLIQKEALQIAGVAAAEDTEAELLFETENGMVSCQMPFVTQDEYQQLKRASGQLIDQDIPRYRYRNEGYYWYEFLDDNTLYIRFYRMIEDPQQSLNDFVREVTAELRNAAQLATVLFDFRDNTGGTIVDLTDLANAVRQYASEHVYVLINEATASSGVFAAYCVLQGIDGAILAGTPAAQFVCSFGGYDILSMPNSGYTFQVACGYYAMAPAQPGEPLTPSVLIYPEIEDYKNGVDTVLEEILAQQKI